MKNFNFYDIYYYDDDKRKHIICNTSPKDLDFISNRFGKENIGVLNEKRINTPYVPLV